MSYENFKRAIELAPQCEYYTAGKGLSLEEIHKAEEILGVKFSLQLLEFYQKFNYLSFRGHEFFGIDLESDSDILEGNSLAYALHERINYNLPEPWIPIYNFGEGSIACLDYGSLNMSNEPSVIRALYNGKEYLRLEQVADDFGSFILSLVEESFEY